MQLPAFQKRQRPRPRRDMGPVGLAVEGLLGLAEPRDLVRAGSGKIGPDDLADRHPGRGPEEGRPVEGQAVRAVPALNRVHCLLVSWGYLRPGDDRDLPAGIKLLEPEILSSPLAQWPEAAIVQAN